LKNRSRYRLRVEAPPEAGISEACLKLIELTLEPVQMAVMVPRQTRLPFLLMQLPERVVEVALTEADELARSDALADREFSPLVFALLMHIRTLLHGNPKQDWQTEITADDVFDAFAPLSLAMSFELLRRRRCFADIQVPTDLWGIEDEALGYGDPNPERIAGLTHAVAREVAEAMLKHLQRFEATTSG
jgi:hypothetical protein